MRREPCSCFDRDRREDREEEGLSHLFHDRAEEVITYQNEDPLATALPKGEKPDHIFGLRSTRKFKQLLDSEEDKRPEFKGQLLRESIAHSPFKGDGESVLFPFLVLEAKSEKGIDGFGSIQIQTAFAIRRLLKLQHDLKSATGGESRWGSGPLVWFVAHRGETWRVAAAYVQVEGDVLHYHVVDLWDGRIDHPEGALQLLLIVDYIFDWARDSYREAIFCELRTLAARNLSSLADDSEVLSLADPSHRFWAPNAQEPPIDDSQDALDVSARPHDHLRCFDSPYGVIRNASIIHARVLALYITRDNIDQLLRSLDTKDKAQRTARDLLRLFRESWRVTSDALDEVELMWTGNRRESADLYGVEEYFCAVFNIAAYISPSWEQVLELSFVAIAEDALPGLKERAGLHRGGSVFPSELPFVTEKHLKGYLRFARQGSIRSTLRAAITRSCLSSRLAYEKDHPDAFFLISEEAVERGIQYRLDMTMLPSRNAKAREMVLFFYNRYKVGMREPKESFLRLSDTYEERSSDMPEIESIWPNQELQIKQSDRAVLLQSKHLTSWQNSGSLCLYLIDGVSEPHASPLELVREEVPYLTRWQDTRPGWGNNWNDELMKKGSPDFASQMHKFGEYCCSIAKLQADSTALRGGTPTAREARSGYHNSNELPLHFRKKPVGHFVTHITSSDPYEDVRGTVDLLVGRKRNVKLVTCLYAQGHLQGQQGLKAEATPVVPFRPLPSKEELKKMESLRIRNIMQAGDEIRLPPPKQARRQQYSEPLEKVGFAGDWLSDHELDRWLIEGNFGDAEVQSSSKRACTPTESDEQRADKRPRLTEEETSTRSWGTCESPRGRLLGVIPPPGHFPRDHMTDDELEAFLQTDHFIDGVEQAGRIQESTDGVAG